MNKETRLDGVFPAIYSGNNFDGNYVHNPYLGLQEGGETLDRRHSAEVFNILASSQGPEIVAPQVVRFHAHSSHPLLKLSKGFRASMIDS